MFTPILKTQISNFATQNGLSFSGAVRSLVTQSLSTKNQSKESSVQSLLKLADSTGQGPSDLASNDKYFYEDKSE